MSIIVTSTPTIMDGYVVRWFATEDAANHCKPIISASRERVLVHQPGDVADALAEVAAIVHTQIRDWYRRGGRDFKVWEKHVTHTRPLFRDVRPITVDDFGPMA